MQNALNELEDLGHNRVIIHYGDVSPREEYYEEKAEESILIEPAESQYSELIEKQDLIDKVEDSEVLMEYKVDKATKSMEDYAHDLDLIPQIWIDAYENETGMKAVWRGRMTNGFKDYILANGFVSQ